MSRYVTYLFTIFIESGLHKMSLTVDTDRVPWDFLTYWREPENYNVWRSWLNLKGDEIICEREEIACHVDKASHTLLKTDIPSYQPLAAPKEDPNEPDQLPPLHIP